MIEKSLLLRNFFSSTPPPDPDATFKVHFAIDFMSKVLLERWNQANLGFFDFYFNRAQGKMR